MNITFSPIGVIHTPFQDPQDMPIQPAGGMNVQGRVEVFPKFQNGLADLDGFSHVILLFHLHQSRGFQLQVVPFMDDQPRGVFATRAPRRPNPIGLSVVQLMRIESGTLIIRGVDMLDGTPLLDIKPFVPDFDSHAEIRTGWLEVARQSVANRRSDDRFSSRD